MRKRKFKAPNGVERELWFRDGTNDESTIIACFEEDHYQVLKEDFRKGDVVIDLGAHIGGVTCLLATIPGLKIIAVEALPENCEVLKKNLEIPGADGTEVVLYEKAIWSRSGQDIDVFYGDDTESGKVHKFVGTIGDWTFGRNGIAVKTTSLLGIFRKEKIKECRWLKTDIEGAEREAIGGAPEYILKRIMKIRGEYHQGDYHDLLKEIGVFEDITSKGSGHDFVWRLNARK